MSQADVIVRMQPVFDDLFLERVELKPELSAKEVDEWDSLMQVSLVVAIEQAFGIRFRVGEVEATRNVGEFADLIGRRLEGR
ncbi:MAG: acyl carrier protein [Polyangiaceae bacterium]